MSTLGWYLLAAAGEMSGCFAFWAWLRLGRSAWWGAPGALCLVLFAAALTRVEASFAGRAFAAYGGVYVASSLLWLGAVDGIWPDRWDVLGGSLCLLGAGVIVFGPR